MILLSGISYAQACSYENSNDELAVNLTETHNYSASNPKSETSVNPFVKQYPAPFSEIVSVDLSSCPDAKICLYYESGKCIKYQDCGKEKTAIFNLKNQPKGLYFMEIVSNGKRVMKTINFE